MPTPQSAEISSIFSPGTYHCEMLWRHPEKHTKEWGKKEYVTKHQMLRLYFLQVFDIIRNPVSQFWILAPSVAAVVLCHQLELGPRKLERFQETGFHKSTWARLVTNIKVFDENSLQRQTCSFIGLFQHSPSLEGSSQQPCPMDGTQEQKNTPMNEVSLCYALEKRITF